MLELLWVEDAAEARSEQTRDTKLWERWSAAGRDASPFGVILRPRERGRSRIPFPSWEYRQESMPGFAIHIARDTQLAEPMWCYNEAGRRPDEAPPERRQPLEHPVGFREITGVRLYCPVVDGAAVTPAMAWAGVISLETGVKHTLELEFDGNVHGRRIDFAPELPLVFRWEHREKPPTR